MPMMSMKIQTYCSDCGDDLGVTTCLVVVNGNKTLELQYPEELRLKGSKAVYSEFGDCWLTFCIACYNTRACLTVNDEQKRWNGPAPQKEGET